MFVNVLWMLVISSGLSIGNIFSDLERCISETRDDNNVIKNMYCMVSKSDVHLTCPPSEHIVVTSLQFGIKAKTDLCTKRVLTTSYLFCCNPQSNDVLYDGNCLRDIWTQEDKQHYQQFTTNVLTRCTNKSHCVLSSKLFDSLQKEIPSTRKYSSYIQIIHQCMKVQSVTVDACSSKTVSGKEINLVDTELHRNSNKTCICRMTSQGYGRVTVKAIDVRTDKSGLILKSSNRIKDLSHSQQSLFGLKEIFSGKKIELSVRMDTNNGDEIWLHISGTNGQGVNVACGEDTTTDVLNRSPKPTAHEKPIQTLSDLVDTDYEEEEEEEDGRRGFGPIIYLAAGSGITIILVFCILGSVLICRYSMKKKKTGENSYNQYPPGQYDTVYDDTPRPPDHMIAPEWVHAPMRMDPRTATMRSVRSTAPTLPPPNRHGNSNMATASPCGVSELERFLEN